MDSPGAQPPKPPAGHRLIGEAGEATAPSCPNCGAGVATGAKFCRSCGSALEATEVGPVPPPARPRPASSRPAPAAPAGSPGAPAGRGWRVAGIVALCLVLAGAAGGAAFLLTRDDASSQAQETSLDDEAIVDGLDDMTAGGSTATGTLPTERGFPADTKAAMRPEIEEALRQFHVAVVEGDFQYAWRLLSARKRQQEESEKGFSGWRDAQATLTPYLDPDEIHAEIDGLEDDGVARVLVTGMGWSGPGSPCSEWSGLTWVKYEGGVWRYDPGYSTTAERQRRWEHRVGELLGVGC